MSQLVIPGIYTILISVLYLINRYGIKRVHARIDALLNYPERKDLASKLSTITGYDVHAFADADEIRIRRTDSLGRNITGYYTEAQSREMCNAEIAKLHETKCNKVNRRGKKEEK